MVDAPSNASRSRALLTILIKNGYSFFMPKRSKEDMAARRTVILRGAAACFARKGFQATTITDIAAEAQVSAGGIYTHFRSKHEIAASIGGQAIEKLHSDQPLDLLALFDGLQSAEGLTDARLDLNLWAEALHDDSLQEIVSAAMDRFRKGLKQHLPPGRRTADWIALFEALTLGLEVQRALRRPPSSRLRARLKALLTDPA